MDKELKPLFSPNPTPTPFPPRPLHCHPVPSRPFQRPSDPSSRSLFTGYFKQECPPKVPQPSSLQPQHSKQLSSGFYRNLLYRFCLSRHFYTVVNGVLSVCVFLSTTTRKVLVKWHQRKKKKVYVVSHLFQDINNQLITN